jgi:hypothetical protein
VINMIDKKGLAAIQGTIDTINKFRPKIKDFAAHLTRSRVQTLSSRQLDSARAMKSGTPYPMIDRQLVTLGPYIYEYDPEDTQLAGLNRIKGMPFLYLSAAPDQVRKYECAGKRFDSEDDMQSMIDGAGQQYLHQALTKVRQLTNDAYGASEAGGTSADARPEYTKRINIIVLGRMETQENYRFYFEPAHAEELQIRQTPVERTIADGQATTHQHSLYTISRNNNHEQANVFYFNVFSSEVAMTADDYDTLFDIISDSVLRQAGQKPLIFHCTQGLDRAGKFSFAAIILAKFDEIFAGKNSFELLLQEYNNLRQSRSPEVLEGDECLLQSLHLAVMLKIIEIQQALSSALKISKLPKLSLAELSSYVDGEITKITTDSRLSSWFSPSPRLCNLRALQQVLKLRSEFISQNLASCKMLHEVENKPAVKPLVP